MDCKGTNRTYYESLVSELEDSNCEAANHLETKNSDLKEDVAELQLQQHCLNNKTI